MTDERGTGDPTDDDRAREAAENPLAAAKPKAGETRPATNWIVPAVLAAIAVVVLLFLIF